MYCWSEHIGEFGSDSSPSVERHSSDVSHSPDSVPLICSIIFIKVAESGSSLLSLDFSVFFVYDTPLDLERWLLDAFVFLVSFPVDLIPELADDLVALDFRLMNALPLRFKSSSLLNLAVGTSNDLN